MPDPWERHARGDEWGGNPGRSPARDAAIADQQETAGRAPRMPRRDREKCKKARGPHQVELSLYGAHARCQWVLGYRRGVFVPVFSCWHVKRCVACGKHFGFAESAECPDYTADAPEGVISQCAAATERRLSRPPARVKGPTHYRRRRSDAD